MKYLPIERSFVYPDIPEIDENRVVLGGSEDFLREDADWRKYVPAPETQRRQGIESSSCYVHGIQHGFATIQEEEYGIADQNYSERFNFIRSNGTRHGGNPLAALDSIRRDGMIIDNMLPFSPEIKSWDEFNSFKGGDQRLCEIAGEQWKKRWDADGEPIITKNLSVEKKYEILRNELKKSPIPVSVFGWLEKDRLYIKPPTEHDNHLVTLLYIDPEGHPYVLDTYEPFIKKLDKFYNFDFAMTLWLVKKAEEKKVGFWEMIFNLIQKLWKRS